MNQTWNLICMRFCCLIVIHIMIRLSRFVPRSTMSRDIKLLVSALQSTEKSAFSLPKLYHIERIEETKQKTKPTSSENEKVPGQSIFNLEKVESKIDMTNNDENVVRTRLLLDGDGTGDDRRLNNISKMVRSVQQQIKFLIIKSIRKLSSPMIKRDTATSF